MTKRNKRRRTTNTPIPQRKDMMSGDIQGMLMPSARVAGVTHRIQREKEEKEKEETKRVTYCATTAVNQAILQETVPTPHQRD